MIFQKRIAKSLTEAKSHYTVVVVGSGYGAGVAASRLARAGQDRVSLLSQNLAYPPIDVALQDVEVIGRVVWKSGRL